MGERIREELCELLRKYDVSGEDLELLETLVCEVEGFLTADGWREPAGQMNFIAQRLEHYARQFWARVARDAGEGGPLGEVDGILARVCDMIEAGQWRSTVGLRVALIRWAAGMLARAGELLKEMVGGNGGMAGG